MGIDKVSNHIKRYKHETHSLSSRLHLEMKKEKFDLAIVKGTASTVRDFHILIAIFKESAAFVLHDQNSCCLIEGFCVILHPVAYFLRLQFKVNGFLRA